MKQLIYTTVLGVLAMTAVQADLKEKFDEIVNQKSTVKDVIYNALQNDYHYLTISGMDSNGKIQLKQIWMYPNFCGMVDQKENWTLLQKPARTYIDIRSKSGDMITIDSMAKFHPATPEQEQETRSYVQEHVGKDHERYIADDASRAVVCADFGGRAKVRYYDDSRKRLNKVYTSSSDERY